MTVPFLDIAIGDSGMRREIDRTIARLIDASGFIGGQEVSAFAAEFADCCGGGFCAPVANGTDALVLSLRALDIGPGDEVITVPFTFMATTEAISLSGARIRFVDINPQTYTMDPDLLEKAVTSKTKALIPVHLFGQPADMDPISAIARKYGLKVIEDACQAHGAEYKGKRVGLLGDAGCFSFYPTKNLGGFGDGGAVVSKSHELVGKITRLGNHGMAERYHHPMEGTNSRLDAIQAAVLRIKLKSLDRWNQRRREIAAAYTQALQGHPYITAPAAAPYALPVFHLYVVETTKRDELMMRLNRNGIGNGVYYPVPLHLQPAYRGYGFSKGDYPVSERVCERILSLPMYPAMTDDQVSRVIDGFRA